MSVGVEVDVAVKEPSSIVVPREEVFELLCGWYPPVVEVDRGRPVLVKDGSSSGSRLVAGRTNYSML